MIAHVSSGSIEQYRNVIRAVQLSAHYTGKDTEGNAVYDPNRPKPTIEFTGSVKLHGSQGGVSFNNVDGMWAQSREQIITPLKDNAGFAFFVEKNKEAFMSMFLKLEWDNQISLDTHTITIFGEWAGKGIQKTVAIAQLDKAFYIFGAKVSKPGDESFVSYWINPSVKSEDNGIYNVYDYETYKISIDFNHPELSQNILGELTAIVGKQCPIAKARGIEGIGEGVVWTGQNGDNYYRFKVKDEAHSVTKVKTLASVDIEKVNSVKGFVDYAATPQRFDQAVTTVFGSPEAIDITKMGDLIRWVVNDITKEETDTLVENGLEPKDVNKAISDRVRAQFFALYNGGK
jgi:RNA ligase